MKLREEICQSIKTMSRDELILLYEQIKWLERMRKPSNPVGESIPLEKIHEMTGSSKNSWAKSVVEERAERV